MLNSFCENISITVKKLLNYPTKLTHALRMNPEMLLLKNISRGDHDSFKTLYEQYYNRLFAFARYYVRQPEIAEDVVSEVFFDLWKRKEAASSIGCFDAFIYRAIKNKCLNQINSGYNRYTNLIENYSDLNFQVELITPDHVTSSNELNRAIQNAIANLPERCRLILKMVKEDNLKYNQIAEILDISPKTVENQVGIALKKIKEEISAYIE